MKIKELIGDLQSCGAPSEFDSDAQIDRLNQQFKSPPKILIIRQNLTF